jgi:hypothetical protein
MAKKKKPEIQFTFKLLNIELLGLKLEKLKNPLDEGHQLNYQIGLEHKIDVKNELVFVGMHVNIIDIADNNYCYGAIDTSCNFQIHNIDNFIVKKTGLVDLPQQVIVTLNSIAISTSRGIMFSELKGTHLHGAILPIIDPVQFAKTN